MCGREYCQSIRVQKSNVKVKYKINYLRHKETGAVITSQHRAWNDTDTARMAMWLDLVAGVGMLIWSE
jgi:hypothetical protein